MLGIFTLMCLVWPSSGNQGQVEILLVILCVLLLLLMMYQIKILSRLSHNKLNNIKTYYRSDNQMIDHENEFSNHEKGTVENSKGKENFTNGTIIIGGIIILYVLYKLGHSLDIL